MNLQAAHVWVSRSDDTGGSDNAQRHPVAVSPALPVVVGCRRFRSRCPYLCLRGRWRWHLPWAWGCDCGVGVVVAVPKQFRGYGVDDAAAEV